MKIIRLSALLVLISMTSFAQKWEFGSNFVLSQPTGAMKRDMNNAFGLSMALGKIMKESPFVIGGEFSFGNYGSQTSQQQYTFSDGTTTTTDVRVSNDIYNLHLTGKLFLRKNKNFNPYISAKAGWTWFKTTLTIDDPDDPNGCTPLESDILQKDNTYSITGGAGARIDFKTFFKKMDNGRFYFDMSVHATQGGRLAYMNVNADPAQTSTPSTDVVMGKFINTRTLVVHEHHVGYVYSNLLNLVEYRFGVICRPGW